MGWRSDMESQAVARGYLNLEALCVASGTTVSRVRDHMRKKGKTLDEALSSRTQASRAAGTSRQELRELLALEETTGFRTCLTCSNSLPRDAENFRPDPASAGGFGRDCWSCDLATRKDRALKNRYAMSTDLKNQLLEQQNHQCKACGCSLEGICGHIDHDHSKRGKDSVRGVLCPACNWVVGGLELFEHASPQVIAEYAAEYVLRPTTVSLAVLGTPGRSPRTAASPREYTLWRDHSLTLEDMQEMFSRQGEVCAVCRSTEPRAGTWQVDHNHLLRAELLALVPEHERVSESDGRARSPAVIEAHRRSVRGVLCQCCNRLLGHAGIDKHFETGLQRLELAVLYLASNV